MGTDDSERVRQERDLFLRLLQLGSSPAAEDFLSEALSLVMDISGATHGYLQLGGAWHIAKSYTEAEIEEVRATISSGIIAETLAHGLLVNTGSAFLDERFGALESVRSNEIQAVLCAPIAGDGVVYLQRTGQAGPFRASAERAVKLFAEHVASVAERFRVAPADPLDHTVDVRRRISAEGIAGRSAALAGVLEQVALVAPLDIPVLISGPTGTGKTAIARVIAANSRRASGPFVELNCAAIPEELLENELFGALPGAHSGAQGKVIGKVEAAKGGTLFLDEITELSVRSQAKLLQLLQSGVYYPLGGSESRNAHVRVLAATNVDLEKAVAQKRFRADLRYRLEVVPIHLPPLVARPEDIEPLIRALLDRLGGPGRLHMERRAARRLEGMEWPGNIRELEHTLHAALLRAQAEGADLIRTRHLSAPSLSKQDTPPDLGWHEATKRFQESLLRGTLEDCGWNVSEAARRLGVARSYLYTLVKSFDLSRG